MSSERVVIAMSGGVDSSVAAALLVEQGCEVIGITMHLAGEGSRCCSLDDADDARRVAERLGIPFYVANYTDQFRVEVMESFADAYLAGRTPIPCVTCNRRFKFHHLLARARALGAERVATGHYARLERDPDTEQVRLRRAADPRKDQSYFLFDLAQAQLRQIEFPLGELSKTEVRARARALELATAEKPESQEICFVPDGDYARVVEQLRPDALPGRGEVVDETGRVLGEHPGIHHFTVGQRQGLGIATGQRLFVTRIDAKANRIVVGSADQVLAQGALLERVSWVAGAPPAQAVPAQVRVRYRHEGAPALVEPMPQNCARVTFETPVRAVSPGQAAVFFAEDEVLGGGWIAESWR